MTATPSPCPAAGGRGTAIVLASSSRSWTSSAQTAPASLTRLRNTRWSPASAALCAAAARAPARDCPTFNTTTGDVGLGARHQPLAEPRSAVVLEIQSDRTHPLLGGRGTRDSRRRREHGLVAARDHGVEPQPATRGQRVDRDVPTLGDERHRPGLRRCERVAPERGPVPARRSRCSWARTPAGRGAPPPRRAERSSSTPPATSPKPAPNTTAPPHPRAPACSITSGTPAAGIATTSASTATGNSAMLGTHGCPRTSSRPGLTPQTSPSKPIVSRLSSDCAA